MEDVFAQDYDGKPVQGDLELDLTGEDKYDANAH